MISSVSPPCSKPSYYVPDTAILSHLFASRSIPLLNPLIRALSVLISAVLRILFALDVSALVSVRQPVGLMRVL
jgi:hypothetical protein